MSGASGGSEVKRRAGEHAVQPQANSGLELQQGRCTEMIIFLMASNVFRLFQCGVCNFKFRFYCFVCKTSREDSETTFSSGSEGVDEVSTILTKSIQTT